MVLHFFNNRWNCYTTKTFLNSNSNRITHQMVMIIYDDNIYNTINTNAHNMAYNQTLIGNYFMWPTMKHPPNTVIPQLTWFPCNIILCWTLKHRIIWIYTLFMMLMQLPIWPALLGMFFGRLLSWSLFHLCKAWLFTCRTFHIVFKLCEP
jgi:hypothetical protein